MNFCLDAEKPDSPDGLSGSFFSLFYFPVFRSLSIRSFRPSTATFTEVVVSSLIFWSRPAASRSWFHTTWKQEPQRQPRAAATTNSAADYISLALTPRRFQLSHFCFSS